jgi:hypothetical protein
MLSAASTRRASVSMSAANWVTASSAAVFAPAGDVRNGLAGDVQAEPEHDQGRDVGDDFGLCPRVLLVVHSEGVDGLVDQRAAAR